jgi:hypothetical protein
MHAVLLTPQLFLMLPVPAIVDLDRLVIACYNSEVAGVVEVQRCHQSFGIRGLEALLIKNSVSILPNICKAVGKSTD